MTCPSPREERWHYNTCAGIGARRHEYRGFYRHAQGDTLVVAIKLPPELVGTPHKDMPQWWRDAQMRLTMKRMQERADGMYRYRYGQSPEDSRRAFRQRSVVQKAKRPPSLFRIVRSARTPGSRPIHARGSARRAAARAGPSDGSGCTSASDDAPSPHLIRLHNPRLALRGLL